GEVEREARGLRGMADDALRATVDGVRERIRRDGLRRALAARVFALVQEASARRLGMRHYPVQLMGGYAMLRGYLAEMQTGEGKTLTAALPAVAVALARIPVHVVTVNEYLARRDAEQLQPLYEFFGLTVGHVTPGEPSAARREAYDRDVT